MKTATVQRTQLTLHPDRTRVLLRPFLLPDDPRAPRICAQVMALHETEVRALWRQVQREFSERHTKIHEFLKIRFEQVRSCLSARRNLSEERQLLLGAYFTHEYSLEAAALFNPSIVPHPDQSDLPPGALRFILSLRATGEGHISSITFRTGILQAGSNISVNAPTRYCLEPEQVPNASYENTLFERKLQEL
ncbi:MAG TPA: glycosidase, partial [Candidatus Binatia bacterium]|nr:glycosidase [Candidatus Binatia bacterium]